MNSSRSLPVFILCLLALSCGNTPARARTSRALTVDEDRFLQLVNEFRSKPQNCGDSAHPATDPLTLDESLSRSASEHSLDMAARGTLSHEGGDGSDFAERAKRAGYEGCPAAENIALHSGQAVDLEQAFELWRKSPPHCEAMMSARADEMGLGASEGKAALTDGSAVFYALVFGDSRCD